MSHQSRKQPRRTISASLTFALFVVSQLALSVVNVAAAAYGSVPNSRVDPSILQVDEKNFLGAMLDRNYVLVDSQGEEFTIGEMMGKPLILLLSYYACDGSCTAINKTLRSNLRQVEDWRLGDDYNVLTLSFDPNDTTQTLNQFMVNTKFSSDMPRGWRMATFKNPSDIAALTSSIGYKYFWEPRDKVFLHPSVYVVVAPDGRVSRYLYVASVSPNDVSISIAKAYGGELLESNAINFLMSACYSYNYQEGKYSLNYPIFIALGSLALGVTSLLGGTVFMKRRVQS